MIVRFDDETTTMQVRAPFLEIIDYGEKLPFMHMTILFCAGELPRCKGDWMVSMLAFLLQYCADANVTRVARYNVRFIRIRQLQHWGLRVLAGLTRARTVRKAYKIVEARMAYRMIV
jgi:hypothetical protein